MFLISSVLDISSLLAYYLSLLILFNENITLINNNITIETSVILINSSNMVTPFLFMVITYFYTGKG